MEREIKWPSKPPWEGKDGMGGTSSPAPKTFGLLVSTRFVPVIPHGLRMRHVECKGGEVIWNHRTPPFAWCIQCGTHLYLGESGLEALLRTALTGEGWEKEVWFDMDYTTRIYFQRDLQARITELITALQEAVLVLKRSKTVARIKMLAELREHLEKVLKG